jgi:hypothetical protein
MDRWWCVADDQHGIDVMLAVSTYQFIIIKCVFIYWWKLCKVFYEEDEFVLKWMSIDKRSYLFKSLFDWTEHIASHHGHFVNNHYIFGHYFFE